MKSLMSDNLVRLLKYARPYWPYFLVATIMGLIKFLVPTAIIWVVGRAVDVLAAAEAGKLGATEAWDRLLRLFGTGLLIAVINPLPVYIRSLLGAKAAQYVIQNLRCDLYAHIQKLSHSFFDANRSGSLTSRIISDVETIKPFLSMTLIQLWMNIGMIAVILGYFFHKSVIIGLLSISLIPFQVLVLVKYSRKVKLVSREVRYQLALLAGSTQEKLAASTIVKTFTHESDEIESFSRDSEELINKGIESARLAGVNHVMVSSLNALSPLLVILVGGRLGLFHPDTLSLGLIVQFVMMQNQLYGPFERLAETQMVTADALGATDRIFEIMDIEPDIKDRPGAVTAPRFQGDIAFEDVSFTYPGAGRRALRGISLTIPARSTIALVGPSGGGKTTVTHLLNRFYDVDSGRLLIDGTDVRDYSLHSLRRQIGLVPQEPVLFTGTVEQNILYGRGDATADEVRAAAARAYCDFIEELDEGYDTELGERGVKLSGGQKQRIAIARAFLKDPSVLILDEATSSLDTESESIIQRALEELMRDRTTLIIAHRLATVVNCDKIAVIDRGRLVEEGSHAQLVAQGGLYTLLSSRQFGHAGADRGIKAGG